MSGKEGSWVRITLRWLVVVAVVMMAAGATTACGGADEVVSVAESEPEPVAEPESEPEVGEGQAEPVSDAMTMEEFRVQAEPVCETFDEGLRVDPAEGAAAALCWVRTVDSFEAAAAELREIIDAATGGVPNDAEALVVAFEVAAEALAAWAGAVEPHVAPGYTVLLIEDGSTRIVNFDTGATVDHDIPDELGLRFRNAKGLLREAAESAELPACVP